MSPSHYDDALQRLFARRRFGARPGLDTIRVLLRELGDPQERFPAVHVAGSKGKGSVSAMVQSVLSASGRRTGLFTSPHLQSFRERIRVDRRLISEEEVLAGLERVESAESRMLAGTGERAPTFFEVATALAFDHFARTGIDQAVVEVGLGGRLDSTNVLRAPVGVVVTIELEHTEILGTTLGQIAAEKAGILHPGMRAVVGDLPDEAWQVVRRHASTAGVPVARLGVDVRVADRTIAENGQRLTIELPGRTLKALKLPLAGTFQANNAALAVAAADLFARSVGFPLSDSSIREGLARVEWPGRLERLRRRPDLYVDVAHTPESVRALGQSLVEIHPLLDPQANALVFGCLKGKQAEAMLSALSHLAQTVVLVPVRSDRSLDPLEVRRSAVGRFSRVVVADQVGRGLAVARAATDPTGFTLVTGSDYLVGEVLDLTRGPLGQEPDLSDPAGPPTPVPGAVPGRPR